MSVCLSRRVATALVGGGMALGGMALTPALAQVHHGSGHYAHHGAPHHHYYGGGHRRYYGGNYYGGGYYGGGYYDGGGYYGPPCVPVLGLLSGNFCNY